MASRVVLFLGSAVALAVLSVANAREAPEIRGVLRDVTRAVRFDISPPLRDIPIIPPPDLFSGSAFVGTLMVDPAPPGKLSFGEQDVDAAVQDWNGVPLLIPSPIANFNAGTDGANPPDPVGDVGPNHYVRMANATFQIFNKTGTSLFGPAAINTLWTGFGGACEEENAGDPIVLYDQLADRWLLTQFSDSLDSPFFNCVALSTTSDPTGAYFRWAFQTAVFPDYPKYGVWPNAYLISTREIGTNSIGVYAIDRQQMLAGNPTPTLIQFINDLDPGVAQFLGDGLLPADVDGSTLPPVGSPAYFVGSMDDGGPYGAAEDAVFIWEFNINFATPGLSTFVLESILPIAPYDTIFPCSPTNSRDCIPQPSPLLRVDVLSYRQRPMHRAAYRNYGSYESIVTNQSVEATTGVAGVRWWEIRDPGGNPLLYQDSTYAPADGINRWMGSIAADRSGNLGLGYSAGGSTLFPSIHYTGRLESDVLSTMAQGEGIFITGPGGFSTGASQRRWGDYTSMNVDPTDDCTFWYVNEYFATTGATWTLRAGSFKFPDCGTPSFGVAAVPLGQDICTPDDAVYTVDAHAYSGFTGSAALAVSGNPVGTTATFAPPAIASVPGSSTLTISNTGAAAPGAYTITATGTGGVPATPRARTVGLGVYTTVPAAPSLTSPAPAATGERINPLLTWAAATQGQTYVAEVATDAGFTNIVYTSPVTTATSVRVPQGVLNFNTTYHWRVRSTNVCGTGVNSTVNTFTTRLAPGLCGGPPPEALVTTFLDDMENGVNGWTIDPVAGNIWTQSTARPSSGLRAWLAVDVAVASDQRLISPPIALPANQSFLTLRFDHDVTMEENPPVACYDGGFVEVSTDGGANWTQISDLDVLEDFQDGPLGTGQQAWCGVQPYTLTSLDISSYAGQTVRFRFRAITDGSVGSVPHGWYVDDVTVVGCGIPDLMLRDSFENP